MPSSPTWCSGSRRRPAARCARRSRSTSELIGGVKIVLGDKVIDGSARAQLGALETALKA